MKKKAAAGKKKICSRGHTYRGAGPCPICWPGGGKRRAAARKKAK